MVRNLSVTPAVLSSAAAELQTLASLYTAVLTLSEQAIVRSSVINLGEQALGMQIAHARFLEASTRQQRLLVQAREMLEEISRNYLLQEHINADAISQVNFV